MTSGIPLLLDLLPGRYGIWRLAQDDPLPDPAQVFSLTCAGSDRSVVAADEDIPADREHAARGYRCLRLRGTFTLGTTGVLAALSVPLAEAGIPLFVISTFATDYLLLREGDLSRAEAALSSRGVRVVPEPSPSSRQ